MPDFTLPAGCRMRITASMEKRANDRHRWSVALFAVGGGADADPRANYGARIVGGQTQKLDTPAIQTDCVCHVVSAHETDGGWEADMAEITLDTPDDVTMIFRRPIPEGGSNSVEECVIAFQFSPALRAA